MVIPSSPKRGQGEVPLLRRATAGSTSSSSRSTSSTEEEERGSEEAEDRDYDDNDDQQQQQASSSRSITTAETRRRQGCGCCRWERRAPRDDQDRESTTTHGHHHPKRMTEPVPHPREPTVYRIPPHLFPEYSRALPRRGRLVMLAATTVVAAASFFFPWCRWENNNNSSMTANSEFLLGWPFSILNRDGDSSLSPPPATVAIVLLAAAALALLLLRALLQERCVPPSRVAAAHLASDLHLPSSLSRYGAVGGAVAGGVHWVEATLSGGGREGPATSSSSNRNQADISILSSFDAVHLNHGFGASSLSWLPLIAALQKRQQPPVPSAPAPAGNSNHHACCAILGHDAPGLGWTDRPRHCRDYTFRSSAGIGAALLRRQLASGSNDSDDGGKRPAAILLVGHSMGSLTTLHMALQLAAKNADDANHDNTMIHEMRLVLVAPALGLFDRLPKFSLPQPYDSKHGCGLLCHLAFLLLVRPLQWLGRAVLRYGLRRAVGAPGFWRILLRRAVWADAEALKESDVLRYQWPAVAQDWEVGLLRWARAALFAKHSDDGDGGEYASDRDLLRAVLELPQVASVDVILGSKDRVIRPRRARAFFREFADRVTVVEMPRVAHDPFEEDAPAFVATLERVLAQPPRRRRQE